jgi:acyl-CoA thioesterase YciA
VGISLDLPIGWLGDRYRDRIDLLVESVFDTIHRNIALVWSAWSVLRLDLVAVRETSSRRVTDETVMEREPLIRVTAMPADTNPYGGVFGGWLMGQMGLACGSFASRLTKGKAILVAADAVKFPGAMAVGDELSVYVDLLKAGRTSLRLKAEAIARQRDGDAETVVAEGEFTFVALDQNNRPRAIAAEEEAHG